MDIARISFDRRLNQIARDERWNTNMRGRKVGDLSSFDLNDDKHVNALSDMRFYRSGRVVACTNNACGNSARC